MTIKDGAKKIIFRFVRFLFRPFYGRGIWVISDRPWAADDNGEAFFKFMKTKPEKTVFVLQKTARDYNRLLEYGKIVEWGSLKHKLLLCTADVCMSSHNIHMKNHSETYQVFLQHGVRMNNYHEYVNEVCHNKYYLCVASETEVDRYNNSEYDVSSQHIWLTGAPRYDYLVSEPKKRIVLALTWRHYECGKTFEDFVNSKYYSRFVQIITDADLIEQLNKYGYELYYAPHPMTKKYIDKMEFSNVKSIENYNKDVFRDGDLLISDYSSVVCDFAYLHKPVIFYQFDANEFFDNKWVIPEFDYEKNGFGPVVKTYDQLKEKIIDYAKNDCVMEQEYRDRIDRFIKFHDKNNCQRLYDRIKELIP